MEEYKVTFLNNRFHIIIEIDPDTGYKTILQTLETWDDHEELVELNGGSDLLAFLSELTRDMAAISLLYPENSNPAFFERQLEQNLNAYPRLDGSEGINVKEISPFVVSVTDAIIHDLRYDHTAEVIEQILEKKEKDLFPDAQSWDRAFNALPEPWGIPDRLNFRCRIDSICPISPISPIKKKQKKQEAKCQK